MKYSETRTIQVSAYTHNLNAKLVTGFHLLCQRYLETGQIQNTSNEKEFPGIDHNTRANFQKLRYFGLVKMVPGEAGFLPTEFGLKFFYAEEPCVNIVATMENEVLPSLHEAWSTHDARRERKFIWQYMSVAEYAWKRRAAYQEEKYHNQGQLFT